MRTLILACVAVLMAAVPALGQARPGAVMRVVVSGDLEVMHAAEELRQALSDAYRERHALVVVELTGNESRLDVVAQMARYVKGSQVPVVVYLDDRDGEVGAGALVVGLAAEECVVSPRMVVKGRCAGIRQADLVPEKTSATAVMEELAAAVRGHAAERGWNEGVLAGLISPSGVLWCEFEKDAYTVVGERPEGESLPLVVERDGVHRAEIDAKGLVRLRLASGMLEGWTALMHRRGLKNAPRVERVISAAVGARSVKAELLLDTADGAYDRAKAVLKLDWPRAQDVAPSKYRDAAAEGRRELERASAALGELEKLLEAYPEVMRRPAPGQTAVAGKPSTYATKWRSAVQSRRDRVAKLLATAEKFAGVRGG
jgi:hypothetical protein